MLILLIISYKLLAIVLVLYTLCASIHEVPKTVQKIVAVFITIKQSTHQSFMADVWTYAVNEPTVREFSFTYFICFYIVAMEMMRHQ